MPSQPIESPDDIVIEISNVWKIFGDQADEALIAIKEEGLSKSQVHDTYNAVVGVLWSARVCCCLGLLSDLRVLPPVCRVVSASHGTDPMASKLLCSPAACHSSDPEKKHGYGVF